MLALLYLLIIIMKKNDLLLILGLFLCFYVSFVSVDFVIKMADQSNYDNRVKTRLAIVNNTIPKEMGEGYVTYDYTLGEKLNFVEKVVTDEMDLNGMVWLETSLKLGNSGQNYSVKILFTKSLSNIDNLYRYDTEVPGVFVGKSVMELAEKINDYYYITLNNIRCSIAGIIDNTNTSGYDPEIQLIYDGNDEIKKLIEREINPLFNKGYTIYLNCIYDEYNEDVINRFKDELSGKGILLYEEIVSEKNINVIDAIFSIVKSIILVLLIVFVLTALTTVSCSWISYHKRNYAIMRIYGMDMGHLYFLTVKKTIVLVAVALLAGIVFYIISMLIIDEFEVGYFLNYKQIIAAILTIIFFEILQFLNIRKIYIGELRI